MRKTGTRITHQGRASHGRSRTRILALTIAASMLSVLFVMVLPTAASAAAPDCLRQNEASGPCMQKAAFPPGYPQTKPHGMMILIFSGGWQSGNPNAGNAYFDKAFKRWLDRGYVVAVVEHSDGTGVYPGTPTGGEGFTDVVQWYDEYRSFWNGQAGYGVNFPICASGFSSGGHMALMLGVARPALDCVIAEGPPTRIDFSGNNTRAPGLHQNVQYMADYAFTGVQGVSPDRVWSPMTYRPQGQLRMPILIGHANSDSLISTDQTHTFCPRTSTNCRAEYLDGSGSGALDFTHADVNNQDLLDFRAKERSWACALMTRLTGRSCR